jgi:hypothetical protein
MTATVLQVGGVPPSTAEALTPRHAALMPPIDAERADFLAAHANSVRVIVDADQSAIYAVALLLLRGRSTRNRALL